MSNTTSGTSSDPTSLEATNSGITTSADGTRHIPSSVRADGSVRKEIRIRPGYRPPEDVAVYRNRTAEAWKNRGKGSVPGAEPVESENTNSTAPSSAPPNKNAKRREARKKAAAAKAENPGATDQNSEVKKTSEKGAAQEKKTEELVDPEAEKEKEAKKLTKKLRQAKDLKAKKEEGSTLLPEQLEKVIRINELIRQLDSLGFDASGSRKETSAQSTAQ